MTNLGNVQEIFSPPAPGAGYRSGLVFAPRALSIFCDHDFARLELPDPLGLRPPEIKYRCQNCLGLVDRLPRGYSARAA